LGKKKDIFPRKGEKSLDQKKTGMERRNRGKIGADGKILARRKRGSLPRLKGEERLVKKKRKPLK